MFSYWWKCKDCDYEFKDQRKLKNHSWKQHGWKRISTGFYSFECFIGSTGLIGSTSGLNEGPFDEVTGSEVAVRERTGFEETTWLRIYYGRD